MDPNPNPNPNPNFPEHEHLRCPRCDSSNTKFCYYNNYNLSQPRHFCKNCRRYWTKGGTLRNIPVGGGTRKITKRASAGRRASLVTPPPPTTPQPTSAQLSTSAVPVPVPAGPPVPVSAQLKPEPDTEETVPEVGLGLELEKSSMGEFGNLLMEGLNYNRSDEEIGGEFGGDFLRLNEGRNEKDGSEINGWPDLSIFTPGSSFR